MQNVLSKQTVFINIITETSATNKMQFVNTLVSAGAKIHAIISCHKRHNFVVVILRYVNSE